MGEYSLREKGDPDSSLAADIHVSPDGKFLYVSVRGPGCLQGFEIQKEWFVKSFGEIFHWWLVSPKLPY